MKKVSLTTAIVATLLSIMPVHAGPEAEAEAVVRKMVNSVLTILRHEELNTDAKIAQIMDVINPVFDFSLMAKLTLGRHYWPRLSEQQQREYIDLFVKKLQHLYTGRIGNVGGEEVRFGDIEQRQGKVQIPTHVITRGERISLSYKLYKNDDSWMIYDVEIQDVSIISSYRSQFIPIIRDRSAEELLHEMRSSLERNSHEKG